MRNDAWLVSSIGRVSALTGCLIVALLSCALLGGCEGSGSPEFPHNPILLFEVAGETDPACSAESCREFRTLETGTIRSVRAKSAPLVTLESVNVIRAFVRDGPSAFQPGANVWVCYVEIKAGAAERIHTALLTVGADDRGIDVIASGGVEPQLRNLVMLVEPILLVRDFASRDDVEAFASVLTEDVIFEPIFESDLPPRPAKGGPVTLTETIPPIATLGAEEKLKELQAIKAALDVGGDRASNALDRLDELLGVGFDGE
jgi:hypothetical protein